MLDSTDRSSLQTDLHRQPHAVVIGSGFGGLASAIRLGAKGYRVTVLEKLDAPGGRAYVYHIAWAERLGAGLDVLSQEPPPADHPILALDNVVLSDHVGWYSQEGQQSLQRQAAEQAEQILSGERPKNWVNPW